MTTSEVEFSTKKLSKGSTISVDSANILHYENIQYRIFYVRLC